jgi:hypothetical protein
MTTETLKLITEMTNMIKDVNYEDYGKQYFNTAIKLLDPNTYNNEYNILFEAPKTVIDSYKYKDKQIMDLKIKVKNQDDRITKLEDENKELKEDNKQKDIKINKLEKQVNVLMRNHYNLILWQAYKNLEYYIIQTATGYDNNKMEIINTNLNCFITDENNKDYKDTVMILMEKFEINKYSNGLGKLTRNRLREAHPNPIEMEELQDACNDMEKTYIGIENLYNHYQEVYDYFDI